MSIVYTLDEPEWGLQAFGDPGDAVIGPDYGFHSPSNALAVGPAFGATYSGSTNLFGYIPLFTPVVGTLYGVGARINGDDADELTPIQFLVTDGVTEFLHTVIYKHEVVPGMQLMGLGGFLATGTDPLLLFVGLLNDRVADPPDPTKGRWVVDDITFQEVGDVAKRSRWLAHQRLIAVLKGINGAGGGYHTNLSNRVYSKYIRPVGSTHPPLPYICVPLVNSAPRVEHDNTLIKMTWTLPIMLFVAETNVGAFDSDAVAALYHLGEDVFKAVMQDPTLNNTCAPVSFVSGGVEEAGISPFDGLPYADAVIPIDIPIHLGVDVLGP